MIWNSSLNDQNGISVHSREAQPCQRPNATAARKRGWGPGVPRQKVPPTSGTEGANWCHLQNKGGVDNVVVRFNRFEKPNLYRLKNRDSVDKSDVVRFKQHEDPNWWFLIEIGVVDGSVVFRFRQLEDPNWCLLVDCWSQAICAKNVS